MPVITSALEEVYPRLRTFVRHSPDPDDAAQEAALQLLVRLRRGHVDDLAPYAYVTARNVVFDQRRARARLPAGSEPELSDRTAASDDPERAVLVGAQVAAVRSALARLPERQRQALTLYDVEERSHREVADALGIREPAARQLVRRARRALRQQLLLEARSSIHGDAPEVARLREALAQEAGRSYRGALPWLGGLWKAVREQATGEAVSKAAGPATAKLAAAGAIAVAAAAPVGLTAAPRPGGPTNAHASTGSTPVATRAPGPARRQPSTSQPHSGPAHRAHVTQARALPREPLSPDPRPTPAPKTAATPVATGGLDAPTLTAALEGTDAVPQLQATAEREQTAAPGEQPPTAKPATTKPKTGKPLPIRPETTKPETPRQNAYQPDSGEPKPGTPRTSKPVTTKPDHGRPDTGSPDTGNPAGGTPGVVRAHPDMRPADAAERSDLL